MLFYRELIRIFILAAALIFGFTGSITSNPKGMLRVGFAGIAEITSLDPALAVVATPIAVDWNIYDRLFTLSASGETQPMVAEAWEVSPDLKIWRFHIRKGIKFHPNPCFAKRGDELGPKDVVYSIERSVKQPSVGRSLLGGLVVGVDEFVGGHTETIRGLQIEGNTIIFQLTRPFAYLPGRLATSLFSIVPADCPEVDQTKTPLGSGPFIFDNWDRTRQIVSLLQNRNYWQKFPENVPERVQVYWFENEGTMIEEFSAKHLDWINLSASYLATLRAKSDKTIAVKSVSNNDIKLIAFNCEKGALANRSKLRQALGFSINRSDMVRALGGGLEMGGPLPSELGKNLPLFTYNVDEAKKLLIESGYTKSSFTIELLVEPSAEAQTLARLVKRDWNHIGVKVDLKAGLADFYDRITRGNFEAALAYFGPFTPNEEQYLWPYLSSFIPLPNAMRFRNSNVDTWYDTMVSTNNSALKDKAVASIVDMLVHEAPAVWLIRPPYIYAYRGDISINFSANTIPRFGGN